MGFLRNEKLFYFSAIFLTLGIVYSPCLFFKYIYHDEVILLINRQPFVLHPNFHLEMGLGRPGNAVLVTFYDWFLNSIEDIQVTRWICLLELSICTRLCMKLFQKFLSDRIIAFLAAITLFTLPPFQVFISWSGNVAWHTTLLLSTINAMILYRRLEHHPEESIGQFLKRRSLFPAILFFMALLIYPAVAMFYWAMLALILLGQSSAQQKRSAAIFAAIGFLYFGLYSLMLAAFKIFYRETHGIYNPYNFCTDISEKISWLIREPLTNALNLHSIYPRTWVAVSWAAFVVLSAAVFCVRTKPAFQKISFYSALFFSLLILSFLPNLSAQVNVGFYRCSTGLSALILIAVIWAVHSWMIFFPDKIKPRACLLTFLILFCAGTQQAFSNVLNHRALPSTIELSELGNIAKYLNFDRFQHIHILRPLASPQDRYDEFGTLTTSFFHNVAPFFTHIAEANGQSIGIKKPDLTTHFIKERDYPGRLPNYIIAAKRPHVYLKESASTFDIHLAEKIPDNELIIDLRSINR